MQELPEPPPPQEWPPFDLRPPPRPHDRPNLLPAQASHQCGGGGVCIVPPLHMQPLLVSSDAEQTSTSHRRFLSMPLPVFPAGVVLLLAVAVVASLVVLRTRARRKRECRDRVAASRHALFTTQVLPVLRRLQFGCLLNAASSICIPHQSELWRAALPSSAVHRAGARQDLSITTSTVNNCASTHTLPPIDTRSHIHAPLYIHSWVHNACCGGTRQDACSCRAELGTVMARQGCTWRR